jgi:hypothetical protein
MTPTLRRENLKLTPEQRLHIMATNSLSSLEQMVLTRFLNDPTLAPGIRDIDWSTVRVGARDYTEAGFVTELEPEERLRVFGRGETYRWTGVAGRVGAAPVDCSFVVYVDDGMLNCVEGHTFGEPWPNDAEVFELFQPGSSHT